MRPELAQILRTDDESDLGPSADPVVRRFWGVSARAKALAPKAPDADVIELGRWVAARSRR
jgi:hypothetical protein